MFLLIKYVEKNKYLHSWVLKFQPIYVVMRDKGEQTVTPAYDINKEICYVTHRVGIISSSYQQQFPSTEYFEILPTNCLYFVVYLRILIKVASS